MNTYNNTIVKHFTAEEIANLEGSMGKDIRHSLGYHGPSIEEIIHDTFTNMTTAHLPPPMTEQKLFYWLRKRCKWAFYNKLEKDDREIFNGSTPAAIEQLIKAVEDDATISSRQRRLRLRNLRRQLERLVDVPDRDHGIHVHRLDRKIVRKELLRIVHKLLKEHHVSTRHEGAFIDAFFTELTAQQRADRWGLETEDNVNVSKHRTTRLLGACRKSFSESQILRDYFPWLGCTPPTQAD